MMTHAQNVIERHPQVSPIEKASMTKPLPKEICPHPQKSILSTSILIDSEGILFLAAHNTISTIGKLIKNNTCQLETCSNSPEIVGPNAVPKD